jgi:outer membrane protein assembly factor BamB
MSLKPTTLGLTALLFLGAGRPAPTAQAQVLLVANNGVGTVGAFNATTGGAINTSFITGLSNPQGLLLDGAGNLFVSSYTGNRVGKYNASTGAVIDANFLTGFGAATPAQMVLIGNRLLVTNDGSGNSGRVSKFNATTGALVNAFFITGINNTSGFIYDGNGGLLITDGGNGRVGKYNAVTGAVINSAFLTGLNTAAQMALDGLGHVFVANQGALKVAEYDLATGALINASFVASAPPARTGWPSTITATYSSWGASTALSPSTTRPPAPPSTSTSSPPALTSPGASPSLLFPSRGASCYAAASPSPGPATAAGHGLHDEARGGQRS